MKRVILLVCVVVAVVAAIPAVTMWLWNWLMPYLFSLPKIDYWQALGLMVLSSLLFYKPSVK